MPAPLNVDWNAIRIAIVSGALTMEEAAERFGIALGTITCRSSREEWFKALRENDLTNKEKRAVAVQESTKHVVDTVLTELASDKRRTKAAMAKIARKTTEHVADLEPEQAFGKAKSLASLGQAYKSFVGDDPAAGNLMLQLNFFSGNREAPEPMEAEVLD